MPGPLWALAGRNYVLIAELFPSARTGASRDVIPLRTIFNTQTLEYEEIPLTEFQRLLRHGYLQEGVKRCPRNGRERKIYRLI